MYAADFPVLIVVEIHDVLCALSGVHEVHLGEDKELRLLKEEHLSRVVSWEIAKKAKHFLNV